MEMLIEGEEEEMKKLDVLTQVMVESTKKVCEKLGARVGNLWMIGLENEVEEMRRGI